MGVPGEGRVALRKPGKEDGEYVMYCQKGKHRMSPPIIVACKLQLHLCFLKKHWRALCLDLHHHSRA
jgi:hypothetical protein